MQMISRQFNCLEFIFFLRKFHAHNQTRRLILLLFLNVYPFILVLLFMLENNLPLFHLFVNSKKLGCELFA